MNIPRLNELRVVIIDNPYDCIQNDLARDLWSKIVALKIAGYRSEYKYGILPVDALDFYACHMAVFRKLPNGTMEPVLVCKNTSLERYKMFSGDEFMLVELFRRSNAPEHLQAIRDLVRHSEETGKSLHYFGTYTTDPSLRGNPLFSVLLKEVFLALHVNFHQHYKVDISTCAGAQRFKVDKMLELWGYDYLRLNGKALGTFNPPSLFNHDALFFQTEKFSDYALETAQKFRYMWDSRLHLDKDTIATFTAEKKAA